MNFELNHAVIPYPVRVFQLKVQTKIVTKGDFHRGSIATVQS